MGDFTRTALVPELRVEEHGQAVVNPRVAE